MAWRCQLTPELVSAIEGICQYIVEYRRHGSRLRFSSKEASDAEKRQRTIARLASQLMKTLEADLHESGRSRLLANPKAPDYLAPLMVSLAELNAELEHDADRPILADPLLGRKGRPKSDDGWNQLIVWMKDFYTRAKGAKPTIWRNGKGRYDSAFLRGLRVLHDALPDDVRENSTEFLGSRVYDILKPKPEEAPRLSHSGETQLRLAIFPRRQR